MLNFSEFFQACAGVWKTERIYHYILEGEIERSYTEYQAQPLSVGEKQVILSATAISTLNLKEQFSADSNLCPGFAISFATRSETGAEVSMSLKALFLPDIYVDKEGLERSPLPDPVAAIVPDAEEVIKGYYLRDEGYSESGAIGGRFTYLPSRQTLEMTTYYNRSVALDQMRFVAPDLRMRTIITYKRPEAGEAPTLIDLVGFGVERRQAIA
jgi:hypothetical protein